MFFEPKTNSIIIDSLGQQKKFTIFLETLAYMFALSVAKYTYQVLNHESFFFLAGTEQLS